MTYFIQAGIAMLFGPPFAYLLRLLKQDLPDAERARPRLWTLLARLAPAAQDGSFLAGLALLVYGHIRIGPHTALAEWEALRLLVSLEMGVFFALNSFVRARAAFSTARGRFGTPVDYVLFVLAVALNYRTDRDRATGRARC